MNSGAVAVLFFLLSAGLSALAEPSEISCIEKKAESLSMMSGFSLIRPADTFVASFLEYPSDSNQTASEKLILKDLKCEFVATDSLLFSCQRDGVGVTSVRFEHVTYSAGQKVSEIYYDVRATGADVSGRSLRLQLHNWEECKVSDRSRPRSVARLHSAKYYAEANR